LYRLSFYKFSYSQFPIRHKEEEPETSSDPLQPVVPMNSDAPNQSLVGSVGAHKKLAVLENEYKIPSGSKKRKLYENHPLVPSSLGESSHEPSVHVCLEWP